MHGETAVIIPAFEAAATIGDVIQRVRGIVPDALLIVVDDGSRDTTGRVATEHDVQVIAHPRNAGKGAALRTGIRAALTHGAGVLVTIDADGQHPPEEIPRLIESITRDQADLVLGARARGSAMPLRRRFTNWISAWLASRIGRQTVRDAQTGFRAFTREVAERIQPAGERYEYEANFLLDALRANFRVSSIDVPTIYGPASHFRPWADTWRMARTFARHAGRIIAGAT